MVRSLVFHLGDRKTGSTSIQNALASDAVSSPAVSLFYPADNNHTVLAKALYEDSMRARAQPRWSALRQRLEASDADVAVISAEAFESVDPAVLRRTIETHLPGHLAQARFIAYVRPHAERVVSNWAQQVKMGLFHDDLAAYHARVLQDRRFCYLARFTAWRETFGDRFTLRPMIRDRLEGRDVVRDFLGFVFGAAPYALAERPRSNESVCLEDLALLRAFHARLRALVPVADPRKATGQRLAQLLAAGPARSRETRPALHRALAEEVVAAYRADAEALDAAFFEGTPMTEALLKAPERAVAAPQTLALEAHFDPATIRLIGAWAQLAGDFVNADRKAATATLRRQRLHDMLAAGLAARDAAPADREPADREQAARAADTPAQAAARDTPGQDTTAKDATAKDAPARDAGAGGTGPGDSGPGDSGPGDAGPRVRGASGPRKRAKRAATSLSGDR